jgi:hypothetical protein
MTLRYLIRSNLMLWNPLPFCEWEYHIIKRQTPFLNYRQRWYIDWTFFKRGFCTNGTLRQFKLKEHFNIVTVILTNVFFLPWIVLHDTLFPSSTVCQLFGIFDFKLIFKHFGKQNIKIFICYIIIRWLLYFYNYMQQLENEQRDSLIIKK